MGLGFRGLGFIGFRIWVQGLGVHCYLVDVPRTRGSGYCSAPAIETQEGQSSFTLSGRVGSALHPHSSYSLNSLKGV